jgi:16S rRNA (adenine1518-N6/adenine1519-N6)-dimethyltransferase
MAGQRLGQHFLADAGWRARIARCIGLSAPPTGGTAAHQVWVEIGAGHGEMTRELAQHASRVIAVELDARLAERLRQVASAWPHVEVVAGDILTLDLNGLLPRESCHIYGNLPYYITSPILHRLFQHADRVAAMHIVVQLEVAARLVAGPGRREYGYLSVLTQFYARPKMVLRIPPGAFRPRPKVTSALVSMQLPGERAQLGISEERAFLQFVQACFAQKRKTLLNNLKARAPATRAAETLRAAGLRDDARAEQLSLAQFAELYRRLCT